MPITVKYVKFIRGTQTAFDKLASKDSDTLYFISEKNATSGKLYLGSKLISGGISETTKLSDLEDILISEDLLSNGSLLAYDSSLGKWVNKTVGDIFEDVLKDFSGATADSNGKQGLVPAPKAGEQDLFLKGDGTWAAPFDVDVYELSEKLDTLIGTDEGLSVREILASALIPEDAKESLNTLKEIADWIQKHPDDASAMNAAIQELQTNVTNISGDVILLETRVDTLEENYSLLDERLRWVDLEEE